MSALALSLLREARAALGHGIVDPTLCDRIDVALETPASVGPEGLEAFVASQASPLMSVEAVGAMVAEAYGLKFEQLRTRSRRAEYVRPRHAAMYLARRYTAASIPEIARAFNRNHPAVTHAIRKIEAVRAVLT